MVAATTLRRMGKKKPSGGKNTTPRTPVQVPTAWLTIARQLAGQNRQPTVWYLISLIEKDARENGVTTFPPTPWDQEAGPTS